MRRTFFCLLVFALATALPGTVGTGHAQQVLPKGHPKYKVAKKLFKNLERAIGDGRTAPTLRMLPIGAKSRMRVAWFMPKLNAIVLEEQVYDLCVAMGPDSLNAMASLLGHELAHFYKDHVWLGDFGNGFADLEVGQKLKELRHDESKMVEIETEADYFGGFFGYVAGYNTLGVSPRALESVYSAYELSDDIPGYPSLAERQEIAKRSEEKLKAMIPIFEVGTRLMVLGQYEEAARCFDYIARTFPSREILNNAGVARALEAISLFETGKLRFAYPLELDAETRLGGGSKADEFGFSETDEEIIERLLEEAMEWFDKAVAKDKKYATAWVNRACVADLQGEHEDAVDYAEKAARIAEKNEEPNTLANARIALGIAAANSEDEDEDLAMQSFEAALEGNKGLAQINISALEGEGLAFAGGDEGGETKSPKREKIDGLKALDYDIIIDEPDASTKVPKAGKQQPAIDIWAKRTENWYGLVIDTGYKLISIIETSADYSELSGRNVRHGDELDKVTDAYGNPAKMVSGRQGAYHVYEGAKIIFEVGADGKVNKWMIFGVEEG